jgi:Ca2+-binding RTX toxin-like protein
MRYAIAIAAIGCFAGTHAAAAQTPDTTPPETTITEGPAEGEDINTDAPQFAWASSEGGSTFTCTADGVLLKSCTDAFLSGAAPGPHSFTVAATDPAGNTDPTPATRNFTINLRGAPPSAPGCPLDGKLVIATDGNDTRFGGSGTQLMFGYRGNDLLRGGAGADCLIGHSGRDSLYGGSGGDFISGGSDADRVYGESGNDRVDGDAGSDRVSGGSGSDVLSGGAGGDQLVDRAGRDTFSGGPGNDRIDARDASAAGRRIADTVRCGTGRFDVVLADRRDVVAHDCERVRRR